MLEPFPIHAPAGKTFYVCVFDRSGNVFDKDDNSWQLPADAVDPYFAATAMTGTGGSGYKDYVAELDLSLIAPGLETIFVRPKAFERVGSSNDLLADTVTLQDAAWVVFGRSFRDDPRIECVFKGNVRRDLSPNTYDCSVGLLSAGQHQDLHSLIPSASCSVEIRQIGVDGAALFTLTSSAPSSASGRFEMTRSAPNFVANRAYYATVTITIGSYVWVSSKTFNAFG